MVNRQVACGNLTYDRPGFDWIATVAKSAGSPQARKQPQLTGPRRQFRIRFIAYDITCLKRLGRVHRYLRTVAVPVQYSVFAAEETAQGIQRIRDALAQEINPKTDDVRIYPLPKNLELHHYGRRALPPRPARAGSGHKHLHRHMKARRQGLHLAQVERPLAG